MLGCLSVTCRASHQADISKLADSPYKRLELLAIWQERHRLSVQTPLDSLCKRRID